MLSDKNHLAINQGIQIPRVLGDGNAKTCLVCMQEHVRYSIRVRAPDCAAFTMASKLNLPTKIGATSSKKRQNLLCLGPDEWMLIADLSMAEKLTKTFAGLAGKFVFSFVNISHRNVGLVASGNQCAQMINSGCPLDLANPAFPVGKCTRTVCENVQIILHRTGEHEFHIEVWRSFAPYLLRLFEKFVTDHACDGDQETVLETCT